MSEDCLKLPLNMLWPCLGDPGGEARPFPEVSVVFQGESLTLEELLAGGGRFSPAEGSLGNCNIVLGSGG